MLTRLDRYLLRKNLGLFAGLLGVALAILLMERMIRLTKVLSGSDNAVLAAARLLTSLVPHYLELALPGAFLITVIISINRLSRSAEIPVMMATGMSLARIARPFVLMGIVLAAGSIILSGYIQPHARYNFRQAVFDLEETTLINAFQEFRFIQFDEQTIWARSVDATGTKLGETLIVNAPPDDEQRFLIGATADLVSTEDGSRQIVLHDAMVGSIPVLRENGPGGRVSTKRINWKLPLTDGVFRVRGKDERELTLTQLLSQSYVGGPYEIDQTAAQADVHDRLSRACLLMILPLIGVVLGLDLRRNPRSGGVVIGILLLLLIQKVLEYGQTEVENGRIPPWAGFWPLIGVLAVLALILFWRTARGNQTWNGFRIFNRRNDDAPPPAEPAT